MYRVSVKSSEFTRRKHGAEPMFQQYIIAPMDRVADRVQYVVSFGSICDRMRRVFSCRV